MLWSVLAAQVAAIDASALINYMIEGDEIKPVLGLSRQLKAILPCLLLSVPEIGALSFLTTGQTFSARMT